MTQNWPTRDPRGTDLRAARRMQARDQLFWAHLRGDDLWGEAYLSGAARVNVGLGEARQHGALPVY